MSRRDAVMGAYIDAIKKEQAQIAEGAMLRPKREAFASGEEAGKYQGLAVALQILDQVLGDQLEKELNS